MSRPLTSGGVVIPQLLGVRAGVVHDGSHVCVKDADLVCPGQQVPFQAYDLGLIFSWMVFLFKIFILIHV